ncbi:DUF481 domain-containing protein [Porticoccaceae bacterium]|nr:DUF481 domain-containing protein [Porticoccaceae bacterium]MDB4262688.1 DUF481 domain-containing protein [Porticoccaceae bacterium]MDB9999067.1 DUF481 domain-containing protein [Porticoccaceae bacterium]
MQIGFSRAILLGSISLAAITLSTTTTHADELVLNNGDVLQGQTVEQTESHLMWRSDNFGDLSIPINNVTSINGAALSADGSAVAQEKTAEPVKLVSSFNNSYKGGLSVTGAYASGNEEREDWDIESAVEWRIGDYRHDTRVNYESHSLDGSPANEEYHLGYGVDFFFREKWFWKNAVALGANENRAIDQYYSIGSAIGRQLWESDASALSAESGLVWISEEFSDQSSDNRLTWSWSADYRRILGQTLELFHTHRLLVSLSDVDDSEIKADIGLKAPLVDNLFTELKLEWIYDNQPALGTDPSDGQLTIGINYSW